ncbi:hypothetical protein M434DRAFT_151931 [Hypoxylon sp. CO27-5]|nr:hypothetical protein M434DRAFT_151931 [Hypoxylon sp. CO27-5]
MLLIGFSVTVRPTQQLGLLKLVGWTAYIVHQSRAQSWCVSVKEGMGAHLLVCNNVLVKVWERWGWVYWKDRPLYLNLAAWSWICLRYPYRQPPLRSLLFACSPGALAAAYLQRHLITSVWPSEGRNYHLHYTCA